MKTKLLCSMLALPIAIQFVRLPENRSEVTSPDNIEAGYATPDAVRSVLIRACYDCHSNNTAYPWYARLQPVGWWIQHHVNEGKEELNFDAFLSYSSEKQRDLLNECIEEITEDEMPLPSYAWIHRGAVLSMQEKLEFTHWASGIVDGMPARPSVAGKK